MGVFKMKQTTFELIGEIKEVYVKGEANNLLDQGWVLLNVAPYYSSEPGGYSHCYSLGKIDTRRIQED